MVFLIDKFNELCSKLENHHNHCKEEDEEALSAALWVFRSKVSDLLNQLLLNSEPRCGNLPFSWIKESLELLPMIEKAFAKLTMGIDYPMSKWEAFTIEEYLNYSLDMLDVLNLINSSVSHLSHARFSLSYGLTVKKLETLAPIELKIPMNNSRRDKTPWSAAERLHSRKATVIHQALGEVKSVGFWVCGLVLSSLCGDAKPYLEMKKSASGFLCSSLKDLDLDVFDNGSVMLKEVKDVNEAVAFFLTSTVDTESRHKAAEELRRKLGELEKVLEELRKMVDLLFSITLAGRTQLLDSIRTI